VPRPVKCRMINAMPEVTYFKPRGVPLRQLNEVYLPLEGFEALRLANLDGLGHEDAAAQMGISRQTFGRILSKANHIVSKALVEGMALCIQGGNYAVGESPTEDRASADTLAQESNLQYTKESAMKKIAITSEGPTLDDLLDPRFGRAAGFIIVDPDTMAFEYVDNGVSQTMAQGAGIQAAENVVNAGATIVLTGYVGPKAFLSLEHAGVQVAQNLDNLTVRQAIEKFKSGDLEWASSPNRMGHGQ
jgi:predicted DNA-binding protein (UPF0251 family)/predicted Fe-Mo cluster-binding NifX family protein